MVFWIILAILAVLAAWLVVWPTVRAKPVEDVTRQALNTKIFKQRIAELDSDFQAGRVDDEDYQALKTELERNFLQDMATLESGTTVSSTSSKALILSLVVLLPAVSLLVYKTSGFKAGLPEWFATQQMVAPYLDRLEKGQLQPQDLKDVPTADFIYALQRRAQQKPNQPQLWFVLGSTFMQVQTGDRGNQMQMLDSAVKALRRAYYLNEENAEYALTYAQALLQQNQGQLDLETRKILNKLLAEQPNNPSALMMFSMASYQSGDYQTAINGWQKLLAMGGNQAGFEQARAIIQRSITSAEQKLAHQEQGSQTDGLEFKVILPPGSEVKTSEGFLMVYAQAQSGPPMPLAIKKLPLPLNLPVTVTLSDQDAMMPSMKLSQFKAIKVTARISKTGLATPKTGEWYGRLTDISTQKTDAVHTIEINQQVN